MTNEDAIKWLENLKQDIGQLRHEDLWHYEQAIYEIISMLKEQEPVYGSYGKLRCGTCRALVNSNDKFCSACGKKIKWKQDNGAINDKV